MSAPSQLIISSPSPDMITTTITTTTSPIIINEKTSGANLTFSPILLSPQNSTSISEYLRSRYFSPTTAGNNQALNVTSFPSLQQSDIIGKIRIRPTPELIDHTSIMASYGDNDEITMTNRQSPSTNCRARMESERTIRPKLSFSIESIIGIK